MVLTGCSCNGKRIGNLMYVDIRMKFRTRDEDAIHTVPIEVLAYLIGKYGEVDVFPYEHIDTVLDVIHSYPVEKSYHPL